MGTLRSDTTLVSQKHKNLFLFIPVLTWKLSKNDTTSGFAFSFIFVILKLFFGCCDYT